MIAALLRIPYRIALIALCCVLGGCIVPDLRSLVVRVAPDVQSVSLRASATHSQCEITARSGSHLRHDCDYVLGGRTKLARVFLQDTGSVDPLVDPVILQVPTGASGFAGVYGSGILTANLRITEVVGELDADLTRKIVPESGHKLVIVDFPTPGLPLDGRSYNFGLVFPIANAVAPIKLKALFAAKVTHGGKTYYPPLFPCATTFSSVPAVTLHESSDHILVDLTAVLAANACSGSFYTFAPIAPQTVNVVEYYHAGFDHYFITWLADEIAILDAGTTIRGWTRTGRTFRAYATAQPGTSPVCRYYIPPGYGDSHFYGRGAEECDATGFKFPHLVEEAREFMYVTLPVNGVCPDGMDAVYRVFNLRADANHRYMTDPVLRAEMEALGWAIEGDGPDRVVMCVPV
jgi:hypothetical protein